MNTNTNTNTNITNTIMIAGRTMDLERVQRMAEMGDAEAIEALQRHNNREGNLEDWQEFEIAESRVGDFEALMDKLCKEVDSLNTRALERRKLAIERGIIDESDTNTTAPNTHPRWTLGEPELRNGNLIRLARVHMSPISIPGNWRLAAKVVVNWKLDDEGNRVEDGWIENVVNRAPGFTGPLPDRAWHESRKCGCDVCKLFRWRKVMFIAHNSVNGDQMLVGGSCVEKLFSIKASHMLEALALPEMLNVLREYGPRQEDMGCKPLTFACFLASDRLGVDEAFARACWYDMPKAVNSATFYFTDEQKARAERALEWLKGFEPETEHGRNLKAAYSFPAITRRILNHAANLFRAYEDCSVSARGREWSMAHIRYSRSQGLPMWRLNVPYCADFTQAFREWRAHNPTVITRWQKGAKNWLVYATNDKALELQILCRKHFSAQAKPETSKDDDGWSKTEGISWKRDDENGTLHLILPRADHRIIARIANRCGSDVVLLMANTVVVKGESASREAFKQALWCVRNPAE